MRNQGRSASGEWLQHERLGYNYRLDEMSAALGVSQLRRLDGILVRRAQVAKWYRERLADVSGVCTLGEPEHAVRSWFVFVVVLDPGLLPIVNVTSGLKDDGMVVVNTRKHADQLREEFGIKQKLVTVNATSIAREILGVPITNTTMVGAVVKATGAVKVESLEEPIKHRFGRLADRNFQAMKRAYDESVIQEKG